MKKILLTLGTLASIAAPIAAVISCGDDEQNNQANVDQPIFVDFSELGNFLGQAPSELQSTLLNKELEPIVGSLKAGDKIDLSTLSLEEDVLKHFEVSEGMEIEVEVGSPYTFNPNLTNPSKMLTLVLTVTSIADTETMLSKSLYLTPNLGLDLGSKASAAKGHDFTSYKNEHDLARDLGTNTTVTPEMLGIKDISFGRGITAVYTLDQAYSGSGDITVNFVLSKDDEPEIFNNTGTFTVKGDAAAPDRKDIQSIISTWFTSPYNSTFRTARLRTMIGSSEIFTFAEVERRIGVNNLPFTPGALDEDGNVIVKDSSDTSIDTPAGYSIEYHLAAPYDGKKLLLDAVVKSTVPKQMVENNVVRIEVIPAPEPQNIASQIANIYPLKMDSTMLQSEVVEAIKNLPVPDDGKTYEFTAAEGLKYFGIVTPSTIPAGLEVKYMIDPYKGEASTYVTASFSKTNGQPVTGSSVKFTMLMRGLLLSDEMTKLSGGTPGLDSTMKLSEVDASKFTDGAVVTPADFGFTPPATLDPSVTITYTVSSYNATMGVVIHVKMEKNAMDTVGLPAELEQDMGVNFQPETPPSGGSSGGGTPPPSP